MRDETKAARDADAGGACDRAEELVAYLYGEARPDEAREFRAHLGACGACREELAALGGVRHSIALWRAEAESHEPAFAPAGAFAAGAARAHEASARAPRKTTHEPDLRAGFTRSPAEGRRSARAALREFFRLSPLWLRAGAAAVALVVCGLAALTVARAELVWDDKGFAFRSFVPARETARHAGVTKDAAARPDEPAGHGYTQEQVEAIVAGRVAVEVAAVRERLAAEARRGAAEARPEAAATAGVSAGTGVSAGAGTNPRAGTAAASKRTAPRVVAASGKGDEARRPAPRGADARRGAAAGVDEDNLPSLSDLLGGAYD
ncbi:MAG TPA: zf-HC2 domain-containing protein [Pyrinomonadaceae bacterium]|nr:zf-HC2 domain-containing protein [Pyrinomonadaceae bacterium]